MRNLRLYLFSTSLLMLLILACCSEEKKQTTASTPKTDIPADTLWKQDFSSPDLALWGLHGPVEMATFESCEVKDSTANPSATATFTCDSVAFTPTGLITTMAFGTKEKGKPEFSSILHIKYDGEGHFLSGSETAQGAEPIKIKIARSSGGYITVMQALGSDGELSTPNSFHRLVDWRDGRLAIDEYELAEGTLRNKYSYSDTDFPSMVTTTLSDMQGDMKEEARYMYTATDEYGNWIERRVTNKVETTEGEADGTNIKKSTYTSYRLERRRISYYGPSQE